jgi:tyrosine-protein kinase Etk/Wzc
MNLDVVRVLSRGWRRVLVCVVLGIAIGLAYGFLAPKWYVASLTVVPTQRTRSPGNALGIMLPDAFDTSQTDVRRIQAVLKSNSVADEVIKHFDLSALYDTKHIEHAREKLASHCQTTLDKRSGVVALACEDKDPKRAMEMAAYFGEVGNKVFGRVSASSAREERTFLEKQVIKARQDVEDASLNLRTFQEKHKIIDLPEQAKATISAMAQLQGDLMSKELQLSYLTGFSSRGESSVVQLQQQISILEAKLAQLEAQRLPAVSPRAGAKDAATGSDTTDRFFPNAMTVPELRYELERLMREQKIRDTVFALMTQRYEMAKIDEARDTSTFQILDYPTLPTYKSRPKRSFALMLGAIGGFAVACVWLLFPMWLRREAAAPE